MLERIEPDPLFVRNVFGDNVSQLFDECQLPIFGVEIAEEQEAGEIRLLRERRDDSSCSAFQIRFERLRKRQLPLQGKFGLTRQTFEPREDRIERRRPRGPETGNLLTRELHELVP